MNFRSADARVVSFKDGSPRGRPGTMTSRDRQAACRIIRNGLTPPPSSSLSPSPDPTTILPRVVVVNNDDDAAS